MNYYIIPAALIITFIILFIFSLFTRRPWSGLWLFFLLIFLATWAGQLWINPFGPIIWGIALVPLVVISLFFTFLIFALIPPLSLEKEPVDATGEEVGAISVFFWIILIFLITSIIYGYYR